MDTGSKDLWKLYEGEVFGFSVSKSRYISKDEAKTKFRINVVGVSASTIMKHARELSADINKPIIIMKSESGSHGKEECYKIIFPEGGSLGCEALVKKTKEDYRRKYRMMKKI